MRQRDQLEVFMPDRHTHLPRVRVLSLLETMRDALGALAPVAESAGIAWRDGDAYDDWDDLATTLYAVLVARPLGVVTTSDVRPLAPYDMWLPSYQEHSALTLRGEGNTALVFNKLLDQGGTFESAQVRPVAMDGTVLRDGSIVVPTASTGWELLLRHAVGTVELVESVTSEP